MEGLLTHLLGVRARYEASVQPFTAALDPESIRRQFAAIAAPFRGQEPEQQPALQELGVRPPPRACAAVRLAVASRARPQVNVLAEAPAPAEVAPPAPKAAGKRKKKEAAVEAGAPVAHPFQTPLGC